MRVKSYEVLTRAVEEGIAAGYNRAHKHVENPTEEHLKTEIYTAVMHAICEVFDFDDLRSSDE